MKIQMIALLLSCVGFSFGSTQNVQLSERAHSGTWPQEYFLDVDVDHFDNGGSSKKFPMRYLIDATYWDPETGPILFYAGNEGDIYSFYDNTGFMTQTIAEATKALVVFGEHRFFGVSYPFPPEIAFQPENNVYLTVEQAMMDYVDLIKFIRQDYNMEDKACIVFGGSYGGMLAAWLRMKFPSVFQGALAASAPFLYFKDAPSAPEYGFGEICTEDFRAQLDKSPELIREAWNMMMDMKKREDTWDQLSSTFNTCTAIQSAQDIENLYQHLSNGYLYMAMTDYPYPANFLEPMPAWPVAESVKPFVDIPLIDEWKQTHPDFVPNPQPEPRNQFHPNSEPKRDVTIVDIADEEDSTPKKRSFFQRMFDFFLSLWEKMGDKFHKIFPKHKGLHTPDMRAFIEETMAEMGITNDSGSGMDERETLLLSALANSTNVYFNYTGQYPCTNLSDWEGTGSLDGFGWNILACNQLAMPTGFNDESMFIPLTFDYTTYTKFCEDTYGLTPDYDWALTYFGGYNIDKDFLATTNIIFSNGQLDPWRAGGLNKNVTADGSGIALYIEGGAHHLDLRLPTDQDPAVLTEARSIEMKNIQQWINEYQGN